MCQGHYGEVVFLGDAPQVSISNTSLGAGSRLHFTNLEICIMLKNVCANGLALLTRAPRLLLELLLRSLLSAQVCLLLCGYCCCLTAGASVFRLCAGGTGWVSIAIAARVRPRLRWRLLCCVVVRYALLRLRHPQ